MRRSAAAASASCATKRSTKPKTRSAVEWRTCSARWGTVLRRLGPNLKILKRLGPISKIHSQKTTATRAGTTSNQHTNRRPQAQKIPAPAVHGATETHSPGSQNQTQVDLRLQPPPPPPQHLLPLSQVKARTRSAIKTHSGSRYHLYLRSPIWVSESGFLFQSQCVCEACSFVVDIRISMQRIRHRCIYMFANFVITLITIRIVLCSYCVTPSSLSFLFWKPFWLLLMANIIMNNSTFWNCISYSIDKE